MLYSFISMLFFLNCIHRNAILMSINDDISDISIPLQHPAGLKNISIKFLFAFNFIAKYHRVAKILRVLLAPVLGRADCDVGRNFHSF